MRRPSTSLVLVLTAAAFALTACSGGAGSQSGAASADDVELGPLDKYLSALWDDEEWTQERYDEEERQRQELIAECMVKEGFEYIPDTNNGATYFSDDDFDGPDWDSLEFAQQYGFGAIDWPGREEMEQESPDDEVYVDPNWDYVDSLSESEQTAYYATLYGEEVEVEFDDEDEVTYEYNWEESGCYGWADHQMSGEDGAGDFWEDPEFSDLLDAVGQLWESTVNAPEIVALNQEWAACMDDAGHPGFSVRDDARESIYDRQNALYDQGDGEWVEPSAQAIEELRVSEIELATADWKCADKTNYLKRQQTTDFAAQQKFLDEHKEELDALVSKHGVNKNG